MMSNSTCNSQNANRGTRPIVSKSLAKAALLAAFVAAATASFGQYNVTVLGDGVARGATSTTVYGYTGGSSNYAEAATWDRTSGTYTSQDPAGYTSSSMNAGSGDLIGGYVSGTAANAALHDAYLWNTSAGTSLDVSPAGSKTSVIQGMGGQLATGYATFGSGGPVAEVWDLSNNNQVSTLDMSGLNGAIGTATDGVRVVGEGLTASQQFATYWATTSSTVVNLQPSGAAGSVAFGIAGNTIAGVVLTSTVPEAAYEWNATTLVGQALNSTGLSYSAALGTNGDQIVGFGNVSGLDHALVWNVAANTYTDLNGSFDQSVAYGIDAHGDVFGYGVVRGVGQAVEWTPQAAPEPSGLLILGGLATLGVVLVRRK